MAGNAIVGIEIKTVLLVAVRVVRDAIVTVDVQRLATQFVTFRDCFYGRAVTIGFRMFSLWYEGIGLFLWAGFKHDADTGWIECGSGVSPRFAPGTALPQELDKPASERPGGKVAHGGGFLVVNRLDAHGALLVGRLA